MSTQLEEAKAGRVTEEMKIVAREEGVEVERLRRLIANGRVIIPRNVNREELRVRGIGAGLSTKVNANIGMSSVVHDIELEIRKAEVAIKYGADTIMDLSTVDPSRTPLSIVDELRRKLLEKFKVPLGTVPIYQAAMEAALKRGAVIHMTEDDIFNMIERQAKEGVDFMTIHAGITRDAVMKLREHPRLTKIVSRGGTILAVWMIHNEEENPLYKNYEYLMEILREYDVTISIGDALRPGSLADATDWAQLQELLVVSELVKKAREMGVQCMVEGVGHVPLDQIEANVKVAKAVTDNAPLYLLGPLPTDIAAGYDHIAAAIGGAIAAAAGADLLCYVTPTEHLGLPMPEDVREGVIAARIAAHVADIVKLGEKALKWDHEMSRARAELNWRRQLELSIDPERAKEIFKRTRPLGEACGMCGEWCVFKLIRKYIETKKRA
ncbi:MAG: phosphomethylpyrimidine synthase [Thermoprotei archaeon]|nr:MAG: phosphomethylpyrimidine synthase [Thermoprotei archaeon]